MELLIAVIGIIGAAISVSLTNYFSKRNQMKMEERKLKEAYYADYINALSYNVIRCDDKLDYMDRLSDAQNKLLLVGSSNVVEKLMKFNEYTKITNRTVDFSIDKHDQLLKDVVVAMREDMFGKHKNKGYPGIHLSGKSK